MFFCSLNLKYTIIISVVLAWLASLDSGLCGVLYQVSKNLVLPSDCDFKYSLCVGNDVAEDVVRLFPARFDIQL